MSLPFRLASFSYKDGSVVNVADSDIVVLVGANNTGKSRTLQDIQTLLTRQPGRELPPSASIVLRGLELEQSMDSESVEEWLRTHRYQHVQPDNQYEMVRTFGPGDFYLNQTASFWNADGALGTLGNHLVRTMWAGDRLSYLGSPARPDPGQHPDHPVQTLVQDDAKLAKFREAYRSSFGSNLIVDAWGQHIRLRVSRTQNQEDFEVRSNSGLPNPEIYSRIAELPLLEAQSDGVRSFGGMLVTLLTTSFPLVLIDEPEAFLHPPQARLVGHYLARFQEDGQIVIATHSLDVVLGLLATNKRVSVVRLSRHDEVTTALTLDPSRVSELWKDPLLRFSRAFDGLFHEGVVVCEGDTDSHFYSAIALQATADGFDNASSDAVQRAESEESGPAPPTASSAASSAAFSTQNPNDLLFTYSGSKHRMGVIASALRAVNVPVRIVTDFDALNDDGVLRRLVEAQGFEYSSEMQAQRAVLDAGLRQNEKKLTIGELVSRLGSLLSRDHSEEVTAKDRDLVRNAAHLAGGWRDAKRMGEAAVPAGDASVALGSLVISLRECGIHVVPCGEVESFVKTVPHKGPRWVVEVVDGGHLPNAQEAQVFVTDVLSSFS